MVIVDRKYKVVAIELQELIRGDGVVQVVAEDAMGRTLTFHCETQPRIGDELGVGVRILEP